MRKERWMNWDQMAVGEDFWDMMDDIDYRRRTADNVARQDAREERLRGRRIAKMKINLEEFMGGEPFSHMCNVPA
ncbi:hypothetical protein FACS1894139_01820 [Planctomycetales bacterium]|jgi:hypothetical protein|nr:hypothetical protein [Planctomycetota bacterium]GHS93131.1 hypothetical protein FACS1894107_10560 [Planctomycetales bacterium]GHT02841.1 hypothetical protein FACS1894139_01820 [Planctomycetales bacterium]GHV23639.1 hypothetical protein AGMMS49959_17330 [Planctomycetales bacterium]